MNEEAYNPYQPIHVWVKGHWRFSTGAEGETKKVWVPPHAAKLAFSTPPLDKEK